MEDEFEHTVLHFTNILLDHLEEMEKESIALKVPAQQGWRVVWGNFGAGQEVPEVHIQSLQEWGFLPPNLKLINSRDLEKIIEAEDLNYAMEDELDDSDFLEEARAQLPFMWPVNPETGQLIIRNLYGIFPPTDSRSDEELKQEVEDYVNRTSNTIKNLTAPKRDIFSN